MCAKPTARRGCHSIYLAAAVAAGPLVYGGVARAAPFFMGSDISLLTFMQQQGVMFKDNGVAQQADQILYDNGDNMFRLRVFVNPQTTYTNSNTGAIQTTAYDIALAKQIKANDPSAKFELDLHYSDTWADPGHQKTPTEWSADTTLAELQTQVFNYTLGTLNQFSAAGVAPDMVEIGNETNSGMLWPLGTISFSGSTASQQATWKNYGSLVISAVNAVHAAQGAGPATKISLTIGNGDSSGEPAYFYNNLFSSSWGDVPASDIDVMGVDYYPTTHDESTLVSNISTLAADVPNKSIMVMETAQPWETDSGLGDPNYAQTPAGQAAYISALASTLATVPSVIGMLYWYPEAVQVNPYNIYNGGATALFDGSGNALQAIVGTAGAGASGNGSFSITQHQWNVSGSGSWSTSGNWTNSSPSGSDIEADFLGMITSSQTVTISSSETVGTMRFQNANTYTLAGTGSLAIDATVGWGYIVVQQGAQQINVPTTIQSSTTFNVGSGCSLTFGAPVTVNSGQVLNPSGSGTINYQSTIAVSNTASMTVANSTHSTGLTVGTGGSFTISGAGTAFEVDNISNAGTITVNSNNTSAPTLVVNGTMSGTGNIVDNGGVNFTSTVATSVSGVISGSGFVAQNGSGVAALGGANTYTGTTTINSGTIQAGNANALGFGGANIGVNAPVAVAIVNSTGTLDLDGQFLNKPVVLNGGTLTNSSNSAAGISSGVSGFTLTSAGSGVTSNAATVSGGGGSGASAQLLLGVTAANVSVTAGGSYFAVPSVTITGGGGTGATATAILSGGTSGALTGFTITNSGSGYSSAPIFTLASNNATTAATVATNANNFIAVGAQALLAGTGFSSTPTVAASGVDTVTPTLTAVINTVSVQASSTINGVGAVVLNGVNGAASSGTVTLDLDGTSPASAINGSITDGTSGGNLAISKTNTGTWTLAGANTFTGGTNVSAGKLLIEPTSPTTSALPTGPLSISGSGVVQLADNVTAGTALGTSNVNLTSLSITGGGTLDIGNNRIIIDYNSPATDPIASIAAWIANGYYGLPGPAIISSDISADDLASGLSYGIGYADGADGVVAGLPSGEIEIIFTLLGDANLDGTVNSEDFTLFSEHLGQSGMMWDDGDFNYDGTVNTEDFTLFSSNLGQSASLAAQAGVLGGNGSLANVPEPAISMLAASGCLGLLIRRKRRQFIA
jgi:autotransporter-associated beta strand protein